MTVQGPPPPSMSQMATELPVETATRTLGVPAGRVTTAVAVWFASVTTCDGEITGEPMPAG